MEEWIVAGQSGPAFLDQARTIMNTDSESHQLTLWLPSEEFNHIQVHASDALSYPAILLPIRFWLGDVNRAVS